MRRCLQEGVSRSRCEGFGAYSTRLISLGKLLELSNARVCGHKTRRGLGALAAGQRRATVP